MHTTISLRKDLAIYAGVLFRKDYICMYVYACTYMYMDGCMHAFILGHVERSNIISISITFTNKKIFGLERRALT